MNQITARGVLLLLLAGLMFASAGSSGPSPPKVHEEPESTVTLLEHPEPLKPPEAKPEVKPEAKPKAKPVAEPKVDTEVPEELKVDSMVIREPKTREMWSKDYDQVVEEHDALQREVSDIDSEADAAIADASKNKAKMEDLAAAEKELAKDESKEHSVTHQDTVAEVKDEQPPQPSPKKLSLEPLPKKVSSMVAPLEMAAIKTPTITTAQKIASKVKAASLATPSWMQKMMSEEDLALSSLAAKKQDKHDVKQEQNTEVDVHSLSIFVSHLLSGFEKGCATGKKLVKELGMTHFRQLTGLTGMNCRKSAQKQQAEASGKRIMAVSRATFATMVGRLRHLRKKVQTQQSGLKKTLDAQEAGAAAVSKTPLVVESDGQEEVAPPSLKHIVTPTKDAETIQPKKATRKANSAPTAKELEAQKLRVVRDVAETPLVVMSKGEAQAVPPSMDGVAVQVSGPNEMVEATAATDSGYGAGQDDDHGYTYQERIYSTDSALNPMMQNVQIEVHTHMPEPKSIKDEEAMQFHLDPHRALWPDALRHQSECFQRWSCGCFNRECKLDRPWHPDMTTTWQQWEENCHTAVKHSDNCLNDKKCADAYHRYEANERHEKRHHHTHFLRGIFQGQVEKKTEGEELIHHDHNATLSCGESWEPGMGGSSVAENGIIYSPEDADVYKENNLHHL